MDLFEKLKIIKKSSIEVKKLLEAPLKLKLLTGDIGLENKITVKNLSRPQLALSGYFGFYYNKSIQVFGNTESYYLKCLTEKQRISAFKELLQLPPPCIIITNNNTIDPALLQIAVKEGVAILKTEFNTTKTSFLLSEFLDDQFTSHTNIHGSFVDVYGVGVLFAGRSGIGKSEIALDLVERGHRLVADDLVMLTKKRESILMGTGTSLTQHFMEVRGLGILDIRQMFGIRSIRFQKRLEIVVELEEWHNPENYTRTGLDENPLSIMGIEVSRVKLPIFPGKNITVIAEAISINYLLRTYGYDAAEVFSNRLRDQIIKNSGSKPEFNDQRNITYFQSDYE